MRSLNVDMYLRMEKFETVLAFGLCIAHVPTFSIMEMHNDHVLNRSTFLAPLSSPIDIFQSEFKYDI